MNREIKFRFWDGESIEYIKDLYWFEENGVHDFNGNGHAENYIFMQYTGLKDKNGTPIYEWDIYKNPQGKIHLIVFDQTECSFMARQLEHLSLGYGGRYLINEDGKLEGEILGNTYENPELLEVES